MLASIRNQIARAIVALMVYATLTGPAAADTIKLIAIDGYPARAMWVKEFSEFFIPEVNKRLKETGNHEIEWQEAYGGTIVKPKGVLEGIELGLGDIGIVTTVFHNAKLPSQAIAFVTPFISTDARVVAKAVDEIAKEFPQMSAELDAQNQVYLATGVVLDTYQVFSTEPITSLADIEGKKVAGAGFNLRYLEGLGAAGVRGGLTDFYNMGRSGHALAGSGDDLQDPRGRSPHAPSQSRRRELQDRHRQQRRLGEPSRGGADRPAGGRG